VLFFDTSLLLQIVMLNGNSRAKWWDNREGKRNPKAPDFKHKDDGRALWLNSAPDWVRQKLEEEATPF